ncbi:hypothetical protein V6N11_073967 [Hibiscus sabdariffa]|uniref:Growth-regulating factor n=1 Tax=Hibiscus sabdariffa TaxID=183260 RepID=A0ABR2P523_9ROSI
MNSDGAGAESGGGGMVAMRSSSPFTVSQWQELKHQALIFKYMMAGLPVPSDLLLPIQKSFESISHRFFHHPTTGYCSFYGKKVDPEPGRCRRTDGKKWRCSKDAYPDSKYCERHMHRGRNRSRKPVESQTTTQSSSTVSSLTVSCSTGETGSFQSLPLHAFGGSTQVTASTGHLESIPYGIPRKDYRYLQGTKPEVSGHNISFEASGSNHDTWPLMQSRVPSFVQSKSGSSPILQTDYPQHSFFSDFNSGEAAKHEGQSLIPFFDEWPKTRDSWSALEDNRSSQTSFSTTQLSISIPMRSSDFSTTTSHSLHVWCIRDGLTTDFWYDRWVLGCEPLAVHSIATRSPQACPVADFVDSTGHWDFEKLRAILLEFYIRRISALVAPAARFGSDVEEDIVVEMFRFVGSLVETATMRVGSEIGGPKKRADCLEAVSCMKKDSAGHIRNALLIVISEMVHRDWEVVFEYVPRTLNGVADGLARLQHDMPLGEVLMYDAPAAISARCNRTWCVLGLGDEDLKRVDLGKVSSGA